MYYELLQGFNKLAVSMDDIGFETAAELAAVMDPADREEFMDAWMEANANKPYIPASKTLRKAAPWMAGVGILGGISGLLSQMGPAETRIPTVEKIPILKRIGEIPFKKKLLYGGGGLLLGAALPYALARALDVSKNRNRELAKQLKSKPARERRFEIRHAIASHHPSRQTAKATREMATLMFLNSLKD